MKRASSAPVEPEPRSGVSPAAFVGLALVAFVAVLLISPGCERGADASKIGDEFLVRFAGIDELDVIVTDAPVPAPVADAADTADVEVWSP